MPVSCLREAFTDIFIIGGSYYMTEHLIQPFGTEHEEYLRDESRTRGSADCVGLPSTESEVVSIVRQSAASGQAVTIQGARTGIAAGAVPQGGLVLNLSRMKAVGNVRFDEGRGEGLITVEPGVLLSEVRDLAAESGLFFPPDPTETSASIGGMIACNASGAMSFRYGPTRRWVKSLRVVLADGDTLSISRGETFAHGRAFELVSDSGRTISEKLPSYEVPTIKNAAGYYVRDNVDLIDLFIGMEGTLGVVTRAELRLIPKPGAVNGLTVFLPSQEAALSLVRALRGEGVPGIAAVNARPSAIEFFNHDALDLLRKAKSQYPAFEKIPAPKPEYHTAVYLEYHAEDDETCEEMVLAAMEAVMELGGSDDDTWFATNDKEMESLKAFRHAIPEAVNLLVDERKREYPALTKLGTDMSVPDSQLVSVMAMYESGLLDARLESVIFGHIGDNHVHVNILPRDMDDYDRGKSLYLQWAREVVSLGGSVSAEHGIGKLKAPFLEMMYGPEAVNEMRALKRLFDPEMRLNPGTLFATS